MLYNLDFDVCFHFFALPKQSELSHIHANRTAHIFANISYPPVCVGLLLYEYMMWIGLSTHTEYIHIHSAVSSHTIAHQATDINSCVVFGVFVFISIFRFITENVPRHSRRFNFEIESSLKREDHTVFWWHVLVIRKKLMNWVRNYFWLQNSGCVCVCVHRR